ncbi:MAG: hypothetical protein RIC95_07220 [Vicingaceae bacterium]
MKKRFLISFVLFGVLLLTQVDVEAQCAMCKAVLESNMQSGEEAVGKGINNGIMYIMFVPYILLGAAGFFMYKYYLKPVKAED